MALLGKGSAREDLRRGVGLVPLKSYGVDDLHAAARERVLALESHRRLGGERRGQAHPISNVGTPGGGMVLRGVTVFSTTTARRSGRA